MSHREKKAIDNNATTSNKEALVKEENKSTEINEPIDVTETIEKANDIEANTVEPLETINVTTNDILDGFTLLIADGKALKLSPKTQNHVFYQLAIKDEDKSLHLRMSGNEGGGLHTKLWVSLDEVIAILDEQKGKAIKSTLLRPVFQGGSANNCGFMAAVLRSSQIGLLIQSEQSVFVHRLSSDYENNKATLFSMAK